MPKFSSWSDLPKEHRCRLCRKHKAIKQMVVVRLRRTNFILLRNLCKECNNRRERGHRREWKREYLRNWRFRNAGLDASYWKSISREEFADRAARYRERNKGAMAIQRRLRNALNLHVTMMEARKLLSKYGICYPQRAGLTPAGLRRCEALRSGQRRLTRARMKAVEIRMIVYEEGHGIKPRKQREPYRSRALRLQAWHVRQGHSVREVLQGPRSGKS